MTGPGRAKAGRLRHQRIQTILTIVAIGVAVALPVVLLSVGGGVSRHELDAIRNAGYEISISAPGLHGITGAHSLAQKVAGLPGVSAASAVLAQPVDVFPSGSGPRPVLAEGVVPGPFSATVGPAERGLFPNPLPLGDPTDTIHFAGGSYSGPPTLDVLVSTPFSEGTGVHVGDTLGIAAGANATTPVPFRVTGVFSIPPAAIGPPTAFAILLPLSDLQDLTGFGRSGNGTVGILDAADSIQVALVEGAVSDPAQVKATAGKIHAIAPYYAVTSQLDEATSLQSAAAVLTGFYVALSSVGLIVGLIFLALVLLRRVERLRRSIGIRRAIGVPARQIAGEQVVAGAALSASGAVVGIVGGILIVLALQQWGSPVVRTATGLAIFDPITLAAIAGGVVLLSLVAGALATRAALRLSLAEALR